MQISNKTALLVSLGMGVSAGAGVVVGYMIAYKRLGEQFDERLAQETEKITGYFSPVNTQPFATPEEAVEKLIVPTQEQVDEIEREVVAYHKIVQTTVTEATVEPIIENAFAKPEGCVIEEPIRVITRSEFVENPDDYPQVTFVWYKRDNKLVDEQDELIEDIDGHLGLNFREKFGSDKDDPHTICVRNEKLETDFEVVMHLSSYQEEILGEDYMPEEPLPSGRER